MLSAIAIYTPLLLTLWLSAAAAYRGRHENFVIKEVNGLQIGQPVEVLFVSPDTGRCAVDLFDAASDIILHFDMRYEWNYDRNTVVLNTRIDGVWGPEERPFGFNFTRGKDTRVKIVPQKTGFDLYYFERLFAAYNYRNNLTAAQVRNISWYYRTSIRSAEFVDMLIGADMESESVTDMESELVTAVESESVTDMQSESVTDKATDKVLYEILLIKSKTEPDMDSNASMPAAGLFLLSVSFMCMLAA